MLNETGFLTIVYTLLFSRIYTKIPNQTVELEGTFCTGSIGTRHLTLYNSCELGLDFGPRFDLVGRRTIP